MGTNRISKDYVFLSFSGALIFRGVQRCLAHFESALGPHVDHCWRHVGTTFGARFVHVRGSLLGSSGLVWVPFLSANFVVRNRNRVKTSGSSQNQFCR